MSDQEIPKIPKTGKVDEHVGWSRDYREEHRKSVKEKLGGGSRQWEQGRKKSNSGIWLGIVGAAILGIILALLGLLNSKEAVVAVVDRPETEPVPRYDEVPKIINDFYQMETWPDLLPIIRNPERVKPLMAKWYAEQPYQKAETIEIVSLSEGIIHPEGDAKLWLVSLMVKTDLSPQEQFVPLEKTDQGLKVDWECAVGYQPRHWLEFAAQEPQKPEEYRVLISTGAKSVDAQSFDPGTIPLRVAVPSSVSSLYGFMDPSRYEEARARLGFAHFGNQAMPAIAGLRFANGKLEIVSIRQMNWVIP